MPDSNVTVALLKKSQRARLLALSVTDAQRPYVGHIDDLLADMDGSRECDAMLVLSGTQPIGFYRLDHHPRSVAGHALERPALGLRGFFIDQHWQRRGLGKRALAALLEDAAQRHTWARLIVLGVSAGNAAAWALYRGAGFVDAGALYDDARLGAQHLLRRPLS